MDTERSPGMHLLTYTGCIPAVWVSFFNHRHFVYCFFMLYSTQKPG